MARKPPAGLREAGAKIEPDHPLYALIQDAYRAFDCHKPSDVDVCTQCCMPEDMAAVFFRPDIQDLPLSFVREWLNAACATEGVGKDLWTYLLPRLLEVLATGTEPASVGIEVSLKRFHTGVPDQWSDAQWSALDRFQRGYLESGFGPESLWPSWYLDDILCMFTLGGWSLDDLLEQIRQMPDEALARRFHKDWCSEFGGYGSIWTTAFWDKSDGAQAMEFYTSDELRGRLEALALSDTCKEDVAQMASDVVSVIENNG